jgi:hypothetical protein
MNEPACKQNNSARKIDFTFLPVGQSTETEPLIKEWKYDASSRTLLVEHTNGERYRYFGIDPRSAFLHPLTPHQHASFMAVRSQYRSEKLS